MGKEIKMNQPQVNINPDDLIDVLCEKCENQTFTTSFMFKKISAVLSPNGKESMLPIQVYKCDSCGHINKEFLPKNPA
tara:strand:- start:23217 stop:23450 length:234 start_codon:yes stop_codon:yes gene_type:complete